MYSNVSSLISKHLSFNDSIVGSILIESSHSVNSIIFSDIISYPILASSFLFLSFLSWISFKLSMSYTSIFSNSFILGSISLGSAISIINIFLWISGISSYFMIICGDAVALITMSTSFITLYLSSYLIGTIFLNSLSNSITFPWLLFDTYIVSSFSSSKYFIVSIFILPIPITKAFLPSKLPTLFCKNFIPI